MLGGLGSLSQQSVVFAGSKSQTSEAAENRTSKGIPVHLQETEAEATAFFWRHPGMGQRRRSRAGPQSQQGAKSLSALILEHNAIDAGGVDQSLGEELQGGLMSPALAGPREEIRPGPDLQQMIEQNKIARVGSGLVVSDALAPQLLKVSPR